MRLPGFSSARSRCGCAVRSSSSSRLCFAEVLRLVANNWVDLTNGPMGVSGIPKPSWIAAQSTLGQKVCFYYIAWLIAAMTLYVCYRFVYSNIGRAAIAVRENRFVAQSVGIQPYQLCAADIRACGASLRFRRIVLRALHLLCRAGGLRLSIHDLDDHHGARWRQRNARRHDRRPYRHCAARKNICAISRRLRLSIFGLIVMAVVLFLPNGLMGFVTRRRELYARPEARP